MVKCGKRKMHNIVGIAMCKLQLATHRLLSNGEFECFQFKGKINYEYEEKSLQHAFTVSAFFMVKFALIIFFSFSKTC